MVTANFTTYEATDKRKGSLLTNTNAATQNEVDAVNTLITAKSNSAKTAANAVITPTGATWFDRNLEATAAATALAQTTAHGELYH